MSAVTTEDFEQAQRFRQTSESEFTIYEMLERLQASEKGSGEGRAS